MQSVATISPSPQRSNCRDMTSEGYCRGVAARALINILIKQGYLESLPEEGVPGQIVIPVEQWHIELLAFFSDGVRESEHEMLALREILCQAT